jgi:outer membrane cobalamin receptor
MRSSKYDRTTCAVLPLLTLALTIVASAPASRLHAAGAEQRPPDLLNASLEDLLNITITTASRTAEGLTEAPARVQVVTAAQIERRAYRSLLDVLKDLPDFKVDLRGNWDFPAEITVQGVRGASRVVLLLDGIRVSAPTNEPLPLLANYPVHTAKQIEIVYGPASAVYGADAFSAVVNIITKDPVETAGVTVGTSVGAFGLYDQTASYGGNFGKRGALMLAAQYQYDGQPDLSRYYPNDFQGMQAQRAGVFPTVFGVMTPGRPISPDYHIPLWAHSLQASYRVGGLQLSLFENLSHHPATAGVYKPDNVVYDGTAFNENRLLVGAGSLTRAFGGVSSTTTLTYSRHELDPHSGYMDLYSNMNRSYKYAYGSMFKAEEQVSWKPIRHTEVTTGGTVERFFSIPQTADLNTPVKSHNEPGTILGTDIVDEFFKLSYANAGAFAQMQYAMSPRLTVTLGGRSDYNTRYGATFNPRIGLVAQPTGATTIKVLYGTAYLAPSPYQEYQHYGSFISNDGGQTFSSDYWHLPNPDLKPQHKKTVEANLLQRLNPMMSVSASGFYSRFTDLINPTDDDAAYAGVYHGWPVSYIDFAANEGAATTYGGTLTFDFLKPIGRNRQFAAHAGLTAVDGRIWEDDVVPPTRLPLGGMAPLQFRAGADIDWDAWSMAPRFSVVGTQRLTATVEPDAIERRALDGFWTADLSLRRRNLLKHADVFVTIENAFDRRYRTINERAYINAEEFIGIPQNPRRVTAGFSLRLP